MTLERSPLPEVGRFHQWQPPSCPVLSSFPGKLETSRAMLWILKAQYPDCQRLIGGGFCPTCMTEVVAVRESEKTVPSPQVAVVQKAAARTAQIPEKADESLQTEGPRWIPK